MNAILKFPPPSLKSGITTNTPKTGRTPPANGRMVTFIHAQTGTVNTCATTGSTEEKIEQSIAYMIQHLDERLHVATLAARANVSPSHYFALFKRRTGCAPIDYFIRLRMRRACSLLDATALSIKEIAAALGYDDPFYFSRIFKSVNDVAPSDYRAMRRGNGDSHAGGNAPEMAAAAV